MNYTLKPAHQTDKSWLEEIRRAAYKDLFDATWGGWDEDRHQRHFLASWQLGQISIIWIEGEPVGMIQVFDEADCIEIGEIQIHPQFQNRGIGRQVLLDQIEQAQQQNKDFKLSLGLKNEGAYRLYLSLGFQETLRTETHIHMLCRLRR